MFSVSEVMTTDIYTLGPDHTLADARKLMAEHHIRHIPIVDDQGQLAGIVSQRDVLAASASILQDQGEAAARGDGITPLSSFMVTDVSTIEQEADLRGAALFMQIRSRKLPKLRM